MIKKDLTMKLIEKYLNNPCGTLSIPYWKHKNIRTPEHMIIVHERDFSQQQYIEYADQKYFRLYHNLKQIEENTLDGFIIKTASKNDIPMFVNVINRSYDDITISYEQLTEFTKTKVYDSNLWVLVLDKPTLNVVGCGIAELDKEIREGVIEWIQVLPEYRGKKIGKLIVNELLKRLSRVADFATVSGKKDNPAQPERLYRRCGFTGNDIWHILTKKQSK